ncbi:DUF2752 domain-containing protein [Streptomyces sp. NPDC051940]|uniref:DUF2752 domain-containing protein n=1 Tax=Streptomyces sp. NPDC051940 TaxID=3155675 RepID=UPI003438B54E
MRAAPGGAPALARRLAGPVTAVASVAAAFAYVGAVDPNEPGHYPACPVLALTGWYCPACGGLRSAHALAHGDFAGAAGANVLALGLFALLAFILGVWLLAAVRGREPELPWRRVNGYALSVVLLAFMLVRNLPFGAALAP